MKTISIILIVYAFFLIICVTLAVQSRIKKNQGFRDKIGQDILFCFLAALFFPVVIYFGCDALYYHNRPRPIPKKFRKWLKKDLVEFKGERMSLAKYNATHKRKYTLEQVYGKKYVASLTPEDKASFDSFENTLTIDSDLPDDIYTRIATQMAKALCSEDLSAISPLLADDVRMISYKKRSVTGKAAFTDYWKEVLLRIKADNQVSDIKVKMNAFYGHPIVSIKQKDTDEAYIFFHLESGKIKTAIITPRQQQPIMVRYYDLDRPRLDYEKIMSKKEGSVPAETNRMPCLICGRLSEDLDWYKLSVDSGPFGHIGEVSICPHCHAQAEFYPEIFLRKDMEASVRLHHSSVPYFDQSNPYTTVFVRFQECLKSAIELAKTNKGNIDDCHLFEILGASSNDIRYHLGLKLPKEDAHGDTCSLYTFNDQKWQDNIFDDIYVERSEMGAWNAYLLDRAYTLLPTVWHGGYVVRSYIMTEKDLNNLFDGQGIMLPQKRIDALPPHVRKGASDDEYIVECCYWNDWKGLVREKVKVLFAGNQIRSIDDAGSEIWFDYDCGIMF